MHPSPYFLFLFINGMYEHCDMSECKSIQSASSSSLMGEYPPNILCRSEYMKVEMFI